MQEPSVFTRIINGEIPANKIYEDNRVIAFLDRHPIARGHTLVVTKKQVDHIWDLGEEDYDYLFKVVKKLGNHVREVIGSPRVGVVVEGFGVPHVHVHLVPIYKIGDLQNQVKLELSDDELNAIAESLKV
jgi:histidine triad (HIT) family protein